MYQGKFLSDASIHSDSVERPDDVKRIISYLVQGRRTVSVAFAVCVLVTLVYLSLETRLYQAQSAVIIDTATSRAMRSRSQVSPGSESTTEIIDNNLVDSEVELLTSEGFARSVVRSLRLSHDPEFVGAPDQLLPKIAWGISRLLSQWSPRRDDPEQRAVEAFGKRLSVRRNGLTYVIVINFQSKEPAKAAKIANGIAQNYLNSLLEAKYNAARRTGEWLQTQVAIMRKRAFDSDRAVQLFKSENHIVDTNRGLMSEQQLSELNSELATTTTVVAEAQAKLERVRKIMSEPGGNTSDALNSSVMARLRAQYLDLRTRAGDFASRYGSGHAAVLKLKNQMAQIELATKEEYARIAAAYESDLKIAMSRRDSLQATLDKLVAESKPTNLAQVKLRDLESSAETSRALLNGYLQKYQDAAQLETFPISDARIITEAVSPLKPVSPKSWLILSAGAVVGLLLGVLIVLARETFWGRFTSKEDVERFAGIRFLGMLPTVADEIPDGRPSAGRQPSLSQPIAANRRGTDALILKRPFSRFGETLRRMKVAIDGLDSKMGKVIGLISASPGEGKSTIALNLAQLLAVNGSHTLLIDCDMRTSGLTARVAGGLAPKMGLLEGLNDRSTLISCFLKDRETGLYILPCAPPSRELRVTGSIPVDAIGRLLDELRRVFDYVILDLPPVLPVADVSAISHLVDGFLLIIRWRSTPQKSVQEVVTTERIRSRILGAALNRVDASVLRNLEKHHGLAEKYYLDDSVDETRSFAREFMEKARAITNVPSTFWIRSILRTCFSRLQSMQRRSALR